MHRKPQLQEAARKLQEFINSRTGDVSYAEVLEILSQLEGFEGYRQLRDFVSRHSQSSATAPSSSGLVAEHKPKSRPAPFVVEPDVGFVRSKDGTLAVTSPGPLFPLHCVPREDSVPDAPLSNDVSGAHNPLPFDTFSEALSRTTVVDVVLTRDVHDGSEKWENRLVEIEMRSREVSPNTKSD